MQNLFVKILVLMGVVGGSCAAVWQAHEGLQSASAQLPLGDFVGSAPSPEEDESAAQSLPDDSERAKTASANASETGNAGEASAPAWLAAAPPQPELEPTLAAVPQNEFGAASEPEPTLASKAESPLEKAKGGAAPRRPLEELTANQQASSTGPQEFPLFLAGNDSTTKTDPEASSEKVQQASAEPDSPEANVSQVDASENENSERRTATQPTADQEPLFLALPDQHVEEPIDMTPAAEESPVAEETESTAAPSQAESNPSEQRDLVLPDPEPILLASATEIPQDDSSANSQSSSKDVPDELNAALMALPEQSASSEPAKSSTAGAPAASAPPQSESSSGLTKLPEGHPGPVLLPVPEAEKQAPTQNELPRAESPVVTADGQESGRDLVLPVADLAPQQSASSSTPRPLPEVAMAPESDRVGRGQSPEESDGYDKPSASDIPGQNAFATDLFAESNDAPAELPDRSNSQVQPALGIENAMPTRLDEEADSQVVQPVQAELPAYEPPPLPPVTNESSASAPVLPELPRAGNEEVLPELRGRQNEFGLPTPATRSMPATLPQPEPSLPVLPEPTPAANQGLPQRSANVLTPEPTPAFRNMPQGLPQGQAVESTLAPTPANQNSSPLPSISASQSSTREVLPEIANTPEQRNLPTVTPTAGQLMGTGDVDPAIPVGPQVPELKIEKIAPPEAVIGEPLIYAIKIRNVGGSSARDVVVEDRVPRGAQLEGTIPQAYLSDGKLTWQLGTIPPGDERTVQLKVVPVEAGQIGSVATVSFAAAVSASIKVTAPELTITMDGPSEIVLGERLSYRFTVRNTGQGMAKSVYLRTVLPPEIKHPGGQDLEYEVGAMPPGTEKIIDLAVLPEKVGVFTPYAQISNDGKTHAETRADVSVLKSRLEISRTGPNARFVGRPAEYQTVVTNRSSQTLRNVTVQERVATGVELAAVPDGGRWDPRARLITWTIPQLQAGESRELQSQLVASVAGTHAGSVIAVDAAGNRTELETALDVKGFADLVLDVSTPQRTVLVGEQVSLRLVLKNDGTAPARNVRTSFIIPAGLQFAGAQGPVQYQTQGNTVQFAALDEIAMESEQTFDVVLTAVSAGSTRVSVQLESADYDEPLTYDQAVRVLANGR